MKYKILFGLLFVILALGIAYVIKPQTKEMVYVYEKSKNIEKVNEQYRKMIEDKPEDIESLKKLVDNLYKIRDNKYLGTSIDYYKKQKDYEIIRRIIDAYKIKEDYTNAIKWLAIAYKDFQKISDLKEISNLASFINNNPLLISNLKKLYEINSDKSILFSLYGIGEKEYSLNKLYNFLNQDELTKEEYIKTLLFAIYEKDFTSAYKFYKKQKLPFLDPITHEKEYKFLLKNNGDINDLKSFYKFLYKNTKKEIYYKNYTDILLDEGEIQEFLTLTKQRYKETKSHKDLDKIIRYNFLNDEVYEYLKYLSKKAILDKDLKISKSIVSYYIDLDELEKLEIFLNDLNKISSEYDEFKELSLETFVYLNMNKQAEKILLEYSPQNASANVVYAVFNRKINEKSMPYFMNVLKNSKDTVTKNKLFRYRYKTLRLFTPMTYQYFGIPSTFKKLYAYIKLFSKEDKLKILLQFANNSSDPMFIAEIAQHLQFTNYIDESIVLYKKALNIYPNNKLSLEHLASIYLYKNELDKSFILLSKLKILHPNDVLIDYYLGDYHYAKKEKELYFKYYSLVVKNMKNDSLQKEMMILRAKSKISSPMLLEKELNELIVKSKNDVNVIADIWNLYFEDTKYDYLLKEFEKNKTLLESNNRLQEIQINTYIALGENKLSKIKINELIKKTKDNKILASLYERLGSIDFSLSNKYEALNSYEKSLKLEQTKDKKLIVEELRKNIRTKVETNIGIRNQIKEVHFGFRKVIDKIKIQFYHDMYNSYNSSKLMFSDLNEKYIAGIGQDFAHLEAKNIGNIGLSLLIEKNIDIATETTVEDKLKYTKVALEFNKSLNQNLYYNLKLDLYKYDTTINFERKRIENNFYIPFNKTYFTTLSYVFEDVKGTNNYGYENTNSYLASFGENDKINDMFSYFYSLGLEYRNTNATFFSNLNFMYRSEDSDISLRNSYSKDPLNDQNNITSMLYFSYYFQ